MALPGIVWLLILAYLPMAGNIIAFKDYRFHPDGFFASVLTSDWVGWDNFKFLFSTSDAWVITRNTILYNFVFIVLGLFFAVTFAIVLSQLVNQKLAKVYQTGMLFPHFLSWVIVSYFVFTFLSMDRGFLNNILHWFGAESISWYNEPKYWPFILTFTNLWKNVGFSSIIYLAAIAGINKDYYDAAMVDGANKWQQIRHITLPALTPLMVILTILEVGKIFRADFGLFYQVPRDTGTIYSVTNVIDTYIYRGLMQLGDIGMTTAAGLYQSVVGLILVLLTNYIVKKIDEDNALF